MVEKRKNKRLELKVELQMERLDQGDGVTLIKYALVNVIDLSKGGIGFESGQDLSLNSYYNAKIEIWTKEVIDAVINIIRKQENEDGSFNYGGEFIGMTDAEALKIDIYQMFSEADDE